MPSLSLTAKPTVVAADSAESLELESDATMEFLIPLLALAVVCNGKYNSLMDVAWEHLGPHVSTWVHLAPPGTTWVHMRPNGSTWVQLSPLGSTWST